MLDFRTMGSVLYIAFVAYEAKDLLAVAWQETALRPPRARWRIRFYDPASTDPFDDKDRKSWHEITLPAEAAHASLVPSLQAWIARIRETWSEPTLVADEFVGPASPAQAIAWLMGRSWAHGKEVGPDDPEYARGQPDVRAARRRRRG